jgi:hypothetical protein
MFFLRRSFEFLKAIGRRIPTSYDRLDMPGPAWGSGGTANGARAPGAKADTFMQLRWVENRLSRSYAFIREVEPGTPLPINVG